MSNAPKPDTERNIGMGGNNPPSLIDEITSEYADTIEECGNWLDGTDVEDAAQMKAVDALSKSMKAAKKALALAQTSETKPLNDRKTAIIASYKPTHDDFDLIIKGLASAQTAFKTKLAAEQAEARRVAYDEARTKEKAAAELASQAETSDIDAQRAISQAKRDALAAKKAAAATNKARVTGLRTYKTATVTDYADFFRWMQENNKAAVLSWLDEQATKQMHAGHSKIAGVNILIEKKAI